MPTAHEPIAVIGLGCRFAAGIDSPAAFWRFLLDEGDAVGEVPAGRWARYADRGPEDAAVLRRTTARGCFLSDISGFDSEFFGISPREARLMDPQQRILLEVAWEALEHAGIPPADLAGSDTGVFAGVAADDYGRRLLEDLPRIEAWTGVGASHCGVANRVSHALDLRGPSVALDTACSSSLVAIHQACQSLRLGEIPLALAGGVVVLAGPGYSVVLDAAGAISPDGRSKAFDARADGYGRGEGAGVVVLKRLGDARRDGDRVLAVIIGGAVHQDGRTEGIMAPSREAQEHLLRRAYRSASVRPDTVDYVEAHGTGTPVGDPVEAGALASVLGTGRATGVPCLVGAVKPNIGHLEAAAGVAGFIKAVLAIGHGVIPATPMLSGPNPAIPWDDNGLRLVTVTTPWPSTGRPRLAGVAGYGYGGTIAHLVLQEDVRCAVRGAVQDTIRGAVQGAVQGTVRGAVRDAVPAAHVVFPETRDPAPEPVPRCAPVRVYPLSSANPAAVRLAAGRLADWLDAHDRADLASVGGTLARHRSHLTARSAVVAADRTELVERLRSLARDTPGTPRGVVSARVPPRGRRDPVWVFSGHGAQWAGMGRDLLDAEPAFAEVIERLDPIYQVEMGFSPVLAIRAGELGGTGRVQSLLYAVQAGLAALWRSAGVRPAAVIGHSVGEIAAAVAAGVLDVADGARLVCRRSRLLSRVTGRGAMAMVSLPYEEVARQVASAGTVSAAVAASPYSTVVAGTPEALERLAARWAREGVEVRRVDSDVAFHSPQMDPLRAGLRAAITGLRPAGPAVPLYTTALPDPRDPAARDASYWETNLRDPVLFANAVFAAAEDGHRTFLEVSAHPVVCHSIVETLGSVGIQDVVVAHSLRRGEDGLRAMAGNVALLHCHGVPVDWTVLQGAGELVDLPANAWLHVPHWAGHELPETAGRPHAPESHTLLGARTAVFATSRVDVWRTALDRSTRPFPGAHPVRGTEIVPAAVLLNTFLEAATAIREAEGAGRGGAGTLREVEMRVPVTTAVSRELQVVHQDGTLRLSSRLGAGRWDHLPEPGADHGHRDPGEGWLTHCAALLGDGPEASGDVEAARRGGGPDAGPGDGPENGPAGGSVSAPGGEPDEGPDNGSAGEPAGTPGGEPDNGPGGGPDDEVVDAGWVVDTLAGAGVAAMGFPWRIEELRRGPGTLTALVAADPEGTLPRPTWASILDAAFSAGGVVAIAPAGRAELRMPVRIAEATLVTDPPAEQRVLVGVTTTGPDTVDIRVATLGGRTVAVLREVRYTTPEPEPDPAAGTGTGDLLHEVVWKPLALAPDGAPGVAPHRVVLVGTGASMAPGDGDGLAHALGGLLTRRGIRFDTVPGRDGLDGLRELLFGLTEDDAVVLLPPAPSVTDPMETGQDIAATATRLAARLAETARLLGEAGRARLWCVTSSAREPESAAGLAQTALWGLARVAATEYSEVWGGLVDLPGKPGDDDLSALVRLLGSRFREDVVAVEHGAASGARLVPYRPEARERVTGRRPARTGPLCRAGATYLVTGGLGALGLRVAGWLADRGARRLLLLGRTALPPRNRWDAVREPVTRHAIDAVMSLEARGVTVRTVAADVADTADTAGLARLADPGTLGLPPVRGVVHAAGVVDNRLLRAYDEEALRAVMRPKVAGALALHEAFPPGTLDFLVLFSSAGQLLGLPGQASYAAANAFLSGLARHRRAGGDDTVLSLAWTSWRGLGMSASSAVVDAELRARGTADITPEEALLAWESLVAEGPAGNAELAVLRVLPVTPGILRPPLLRDLAGDPGPSPAPGPSSAPGADQGPDWRDLSGAPLVDLLRDEVRRAVAAALRTDPEAVDVRRPLAEIGVDSLLAVMLRRTLSERLRISLPMSLLWNRPTVSDITDYLAEQRRSDP
ncbi:type I polyketide synthase [Streptosporangium sp. H16]|uniref:type I polyketide synthase n=1 Tax=Streptosporangium sp. H16 TaxID=3444184 RepID=UPI003F7AA479